MGSGFFKANNRRCVFVHIPRTAGTSISKSLGVSGPGLHLTINWFPKRYFSCAFVRNPWDRAVSAFFFLSQGGQAYNLRNTFYKVIYFSKYKENFTHFVEGSLTENRPSVFRIPHFRPQYEYICDKAGNLSVDWVGKYGNLEQDLHSLTEKLDLSIDQLPHLEPSKHKNYKKYYTEDTKEIVRKAYKQDVEKFNYSF